MTILNFIDYVRDLARKEGKGNSARPDAITVLCTNLRGALIAPALEAETGVMMLDSVSIALWDSLRLAGADPARLSAYGRLFVTA